MHVPIPVDDVLLLALFDARLLGAVASRTAFDDVDVQQVLRVRHIVNARVRPDDVGPRLNCFLERDLGMAAMIDGSDAPERSREVGISICVNGVNRDFVPVLERRIDAIDARVPPLRVLLLAASAAVDALQMTEQLSPAQRSFDVRDRCVGWVPIRPLCWVVRWCISCHRRVLR
jgi:hypothetical protein